MAHLFTLHDPGHIHASLGALALLSFLYFYAGIVTSGRLPPHVPPAVILMHTALSASSLVFSVPRNRVKRQPTLIHFEYRAHALIFTMRSGLIHAANSVGAAAAVRLAVVLAASAAADWVTATYGEPGVTTVRGNGRFRDIRVKTLVPLYSIYQIIASASHIYDVGPPTFSGYNTLIAIQSSAFGMTLCRKGLIRWQTHAATYSLCLLLSGYAVVLQTVLAPPPDCYTFWALTALVAAARIGGGWNKYALWLAFTAAWCCRDQLNDILPPKP